VVKKIKARIVGSCATVLGNFIPSISVSKAGETCALVKQTDTELYFEDRKSNEIKTIADLIQFDNNNSCVSYVMPKAITGLGTRRFVKGMHLLNVRSSSKRPVLFNRYFSTFGNNHQSKENLEEELMLLKDNSKNNNVEKVNVTVRKLLASPEFWIHCYESIKSNPGTSALGGGVNGQKPDTLDGIDLDFFNTLSHKIVSGKFNFGATRQTFIPKSNSGNRVLGIADSRDKIVQKGMAIILELTSEHRFVDNSFGFRRSKSAHDAISFIKKKVPSGM